MSEFSTLIEMFPKLPENTLLAIWQSCEGDFSAALDEALTFTSLKTDQGPSYGEEVWESPNVDPTNSDTSDDAESNPFIERSGEDARKAHPLPWDSKESKAGYVIGSGELGLLNELQLPRRGSAISLTPDFLRLPQSDEVDDPLTGALRDDTSHTCDVALDTSESARISTWSSDEYHSSNHLANPDLSKLRRPNATIDKSTSVVPAPDTKALSVDEIRQKHRQRQSPKHSVDVWQVAGTRGRKPGGHDFLGLRDVVAAGRHIENASSADRIAQFPPGTRFRVAVEKGVSGLGITVKEIQGRFFVYRLQTLPDGSPGAAEEAGVQEGDELLGVEELDFEADRWDIDQLVSYMRMLAGVVILHIMRGRGPIQESDKDEEQAGMSQGVQRFDGERGRGDVGGPDPRGSTDPHRKNAENARQLVELLKQEGLLRPSEAENTSRLYCQIRDRAQQWDSGELWVSVAELTRRPSPKAARASSGPWEPGEPAGWDESDSSGGDSPLSVTTRRINSRDGMKDSPRHPERRIGGPDEPADLDSIGTALLGQPLFSDTLSVVELAALGRGKVKGKDGRAEWSPWPQLDALECDGGTQRSEVPTHGIRKALNVRVLEEVGSIKPPHGAGKRGSNKKGDKMNDTQQQSTPYIVWVMDVESGAEWRVQRTHAEFSELREVCTGMRPSLGRLDFPSWLPDIRETPGTIEARRPRLEGYLQRLCSLLYMGPLHPLSAHLAHLLQDFLGTTPRVETLTHLQRSRPERELRQAFQVRAWQVLRLPPLERAVAEFVKEVTHSPVGSGRKAIPADVILKKLTEIIDRLQYIITEGCFDELREMARTFRSSQERVEQAAGTDTAEGKDGGAGSNSMRTGAQGQKSGEGQEEESRDKGGGEDTPRGGHAKGSGNENAASMEDMAVEDEALELISGSVRRQVEAEVFVPIMGRLFHLLQAEGDRAQQEKAVSAGIRQARGKPQSYYDIPIRYISPSSWGSASRLLKAVGSFTLPSDKLDALVAVAHAIPALYRAEHPDDTSHELGADDFLPIFVYVLVHSGVEAVVSLAVVLDSLCDPKRMMGEAGFCVATLSAAIQHLVRSVRNSSRKKTRSSSLLSRRSL